MPVEGGVDYIRFSCTLLLLACVHLPVRINLLLHALELCVRSLWPMARAGKKETSCPYSCCTLYLNGIRNQFVRTCSICSLSSCRRHLSREALQSGPVLAGGSVVACCSLCLAPFPVSLAVAVFGAGLVGAVGIAPTSLTLVATCFCCCDCWHYQDYLQVISRTVPSTCD